MNFGCLRRAVCDACHYPGRLRLRLLIRVIFMTRLIDVNNGASLNPPAKTRGLRKDLRQFLRQTEYGFYLHHPFYNGPLSVSQNLDELHHLIDERTAAGGEPWMHDDWDEALGRIHIHSQLEYFAAIAKFVPDARYWDVLSRVFQMQDILHPDVELLDRMFRSDRPGRENLMTECEQDVFKRLPGMLTVYRGYDGDRYWEGAADGLSWTLDHRVAVWFGNWCRDSESPSVVTGRIRKSHVWAYLHGGDLILPPEKVTRRKVTSAFSEEARRVCMSEFSTPAFNVENIIAK